MLKINEIKNRNPKNIVIEFDGKKMNWINLEIFWKIKMYFLLIKIKRLWVFLNILS